MLISWHLELRVPAVHPPAPQEAITIHTWRRRDVKVNNKRFHWNATLINLPPRSHQMRRLQPTQASINRLPKGSRNVLLAHIVPEAPRSRAHVTKGESHCARRLCVLLCAPKA